MKAIKYLSFCALVLTFGACTKNNDGVKATLENALPAIQITSLGLPGQTPPFEQKDVIQVVFGGALTKTESGAFDFAWYDDAKVPVRVDSVHFDAWTQVASAATAQNAITTTFSPTTYANTQGFTGNLVLKLTKLPTGGKAYTLRVYARTRDNKMATVAVSKLITIK